MAGKPGGNSGHGFVFYNLHVRGALLSGSVFFNTKDTKQAQSAQTSPRELCVNLCGLCVKTAKYPIDFFISLHKQSPTKIVYTNMKYIIGILVAFLLLSFNDKGRHWYNAWDYRCKYETKQGRIDGKYTSYYNNGQKKAEGVLVNNYHSGTWCLWDYHGNLILKRNYSNPFEYEWLYPETAKKHKPDYTLKRDSIGCYAHMWFTEEKVFAAHRNWRIIEPALNPLLFENDRLFNTLQRLVQQQQVIAYTTDSLEDGDSLNQIKPGELRIIGFKTIEDFILDKERQTAEYYTFAICPVAVYKNTSDTVDLYWLKLNKLRKFLVKETLVSKDLPPYISNIDDLFFMHGFQSHVYKTDFLANQTHPNSLPDEMNQLLHVDLDNIDNEHLLWAYILKDAK